jgi:hypothetical protein
LPASSPTSFISNSRWNTGLGLMYIWDPYPTIVKGKLESYSSSISKSSSIQYYHQNHLSHCPPIFSACANLLSTALLLTLSYCNPSCCPLASPLLQFSSFHPQGRFQYGRPSSYR